MMDNTSGCTEEISYLVNGTQETREILDLGSGPKAEFILKDPSPFDPDGVSRSLLIRVKDGIDIFDITLEINVEDSTFCIDTGVYEVNTLDSNVGLLSAGYLMNFDAYNSSITVGSGSLEITKCDFENRFISGNFSFDLFKGFTQESISITGSVFEDVCLNI